MIRALLFDIDGTLITTGGAGVKAFGAAFESEFQIKNAAEGLHFAGRTDSSLLREIFLRHGIEHTEQNIERFRDSYVFWLDHYLSQLPGKVCPGTFETLGKVRELDSKIILGLLTGNIRLGAEIKLRHFGLWDYFQIGAFGDDHEDRNQISCIAQQRCTLPAGGAVQGSEILVIGDTPHDVTCGRAIGAQVMAVATGTYTVGELKSCGPDYVLENFLQADWESILQSGSTPSSP
jgi:phosphoglycolate phosphatase-like HAD superfamily hydrolase